MKKISPTLWLRLRYGKALGVSAFLICIAVASLVYEIIADSGKIIPLWIAIFVLILVCFISIAAAFIKGKFSLIPNTYIDQLNSDGIYKCAFCTPDSLQKACKMTKPYYGHEYVLPELVEQWRLKNPKAFIEITNAHADLCASFGILALKNSFMDQFLDGKLSDTQLKTDDILSFEESKKCTRLYISGVIVLDPHSFLAAKRADVMLWTILYFLKKIYGLRRQRTLYAIAVTKDSERLMKKLNFHIACQSNNRVDKCSLYSYTLNKKTWNELAHKIGNYSKMCDFQF